MQEMLRRIEALEARVGAIRTGGRGLPALWQLTADNGDGSFAVQAVYDDSTLQAGATLDAVKPSVSSLDCLLVGVGNGTTRFVTLGTVMPITVCLQATDLDEGEWTDLANFTLPTGKRMYILRACISDHTGAADAGYSMQAYDVTLGDSICATSSATVVEGTLASPLGTSAEAHQVVVRAYNNSGSDAYLTGFMTFIIL